MWQRWRPVTSKIGIRAGGHPGIVGGRCEQAHARTGGPGDGIRIGSGKD
ncbi:MAG: hypothetical protein ACRDTU_03070 [Micromonosporaceae bacterium]